MTNRQAVEAYRAYAASKSETERAEAKVKTGVFTGAYAINPCNDAPTPIFIADYVLSGYGTGAIMAVPAHDDRDFEFAVALGLPVRDVVYPRPVEVMLYFAQTAYGNGEAGPDWRDELADLLGISTSSIGEDKPLDSLLHIVRTRRSKPERFAVQPVMIEPGAEVCDVPGAIGQRRGSTRAVWLETIDSLGFANFSDLRRRLLIDHSYQLTQGQAFTEPGVAVHSSSKHLSLDGLPTREAKQKMIDWLELSGHGRLAVTYKLRDWLFSRQRYWGEPFPIVYDESGVTQDLPESQLPVLLPELSNFQPESSNDPNAPVRTPLNRAAEWVAAELDLGHGRRRYTRETNTMPNWAGSCWYYLRYLDPENKNAFCAAPVDAYWMAGQSHAPAPGQPAPRSSRVGGVDLYVGGVEHAVLHLLYARFWHKVLFDLGFVSTSEPFQRLFNQGYIQAYAYKDSRGVYVEASTVTLADGTLAMDNQDMPGPYFCNGVKVGREYGKMG
jgi:leucyl-tRNA synthetase